MIGPHVYHVSPWRRALLWIVLAPIIGGLLLLGTAEGGAEARPFVITAGLVLLIALPFQLIVDRTRLELSPEGLCLRQTGYRLSARWSDIVDLRLTRGREGFVTREPMVGKGAARLAAFRDVGLRGFELYDAEQQQLLAERRLIPIEAFAWHLRRGAMGRDIARFAPHLAPLLSS